MHDSQLHALLEVVDARVAYHQAARRFDTALDTARELEISLQTIADSAGLSKQTVMRRYLRRVETNAKGA